MPRSLTGSGVKNGLTKAPPRKNKGAGTSYHCQGSVFITTNKGNLGRESGSPYVLAAQAWL